MNENGSDLGVCKVVVEYDIRSGKYDLHTNITDEVITIGMLERAREVVKTEFRLREIKELQKKSETAIVIPSVQ